MKYSFLLFALLWSSILYSQIDELVNTIADNGSLGFDRDEQYRHFEKMNELASLDQLIKLVDHKSPAVRGYSFWALAKRHYPDLESIFIAHMDDNELVLQRNGCMKGQESVISFMRQVVTPHMYDTSCKKLSKAVRDRVTIH
ncbi:MAG: hypothetical protein KJP00_15975 [Bacteroidia bacterium]|nr:hypothetical protein [Bacteroidia bacterium]